MSTYGSGDGDTIITQYVNAHLNKGIKQKHLDFILDAIDEYVEIIEGLIERNSHDKDNEVHPA